MKTTQKTGIEIASSCGNTSSLDILLEKRNKADGVKKLQSSFMITAKEVANHVGKTVQEIYLYLDCFEQKKYKSTYKPILVQGKDWDYVRGRICLSEKSFEILKTWIEKRRMAKKSEA